jgi:hypothetical protein
LADEMSRVTVIGAHRRVDVAVPANTPIGEYTARLAAMCGQERDDALPPAWSLAVAGEAVMPLDASLSELGVTDGRVLYLRDLADGPGEPPMVEDLEEIIAEETRQQRARMMPTGVLYLSLGLLWLFAAAMVAGLSENPATLAITLLTMVALTVLGASWMLQQRRYSLPPALTVALGLSAVPLLTAAGIEGAEVFGVSPWAGGIIGANLGTAMVLAITPSAAVFAVEVQAVAAAVLGLLLVGLNADRIEGAAVVTALAIGMYALARRTAATVTAWGRRPVNTRTLTETGADRTIELVRFSGRLLGVVLAGPTIAMLTALPLLALTGRPIPVSLALVVSLALLARARLAGFTAELVAYGITGAAGLFVTLLGGARFLGASPAMTTTILIAGGLLIVAIGIGASVLQPGPDADPRIGITGRPRRKRSRAEILGTISAVAIVPLTMAVLGVFTNLAEAGKHLF